MKIKVRKKSIIVAMYLLAMFMLVACFSYYFEFPFHRDFISPYLFKFVCKFDVEKVDI